MNDQSLPAIEFLNSAKKLQPLTGNNFNIEANKLGEKLINTYPFKPWQSQLVYQGSGSISPQFFIGHWALELMKEGCEPSKIIDEAAQIIQSDSAEFFHIIIVIGLNLEEKTKLGADVELWPWEDVPLLHGEERVNYNDTMLTQRHGLSQRELENNLPRCAAVRRFTAKPLLTGSDQDSEKRWDAELPEQRKFRDRVISALVLSSCRKVRTASEIFVPVSKWTPIRNLSSMFSPHQTGLHCASQTDLKAAVSFYKKLVNFKEEEVIHRVAERVARTMETKRSVNKAIDFGVALEILLMHGENSGNSEMTNKIQTRAGWLLGDDPASRAKWAEKAKNLYDARSKVVHTGQISEKVMKTYNSDQAHQLIYRICATLLNRGRYPEWRMLVFGG